jgi:hypothetical protein
VISSNPVSGQLPCSRRLVQNWTSVRNGMKGEDSVLPRTTELDNILVRREACRLECFGGLFFRWL